MTSAEEPVPPEISCRPCLSVSIRSEGKRGGTNDDWQSSIYRHGDGRDGLRFSHQVKYTQVAIALKFCLGL